MARATSGCRLPGQSGNDSLLIGSGGVVFGARTSCCEQTYYDKRESCVVNSPTSAAGQSAGCLRSGNR